MKIINDINEILKKNNIKMKLDNKNINENLKDLGINSLMSMTIIVDLEEKYNIQIPDELLITIKTPNDLIKIIEKLKK